ncbi:hypothetical protein [Nonomuraea sp. NPDC048916]|uniref:hypothetical protein n=1 Tax=Nonomuraea sp. NPDC048916 TaxID=3154232 RepID=UPI0033E0C2FD
MLRTTYPGWEIHRVVHAAGERWTATIRRPLTAEMVAAGVVRDVSQPDASSLASTLAHQAFLVHNARACTWPRPVGARPA